MNAFAEFGEVNFRVDTISLAFYTTPVASVPEPSTYGMLLLGLAGLGYATRRKWLPNKEFKGGKE